MGHRIAFLILIAALSAPFTALAAVPTTALVEGVLLSAGGSTAADGDYELTFGVYEASAGGAAAWTETATVKITGGRFEHVLGSKTPIEADKIVALKAQFLSVKVGADPELPRQQLHATLFAMVAASAQSLNCVGCVGADNIAAGGVAAAKVAFNYAASSTKGGPALDLACTACVSVAELKFDGDVDLGGNSLKAKNGTFSGDMAAKTVTATEFVGDGSKLTGIKTASGNCKVAGEVVKGINADGTLICIAAGLVPDGLNEISNDLLSNQFVDTIPTAEKNVAIPDNTGAEAVSNIEFPDIGIAQSFAVTLQVSNTDLANISLVLLPPDDKKVGYIVCDPCGEKDAKALTLELPKTALKTGDLSTWIGKNPKGLWTLKAKDTSYCIVQAPGNSDICDPTAKTDGKIVDWAITIQTLSNKKVAMTGDFLVSGKITTDPGNGAGVVPAANGKTQQGLFAELAGNNWKQCTWKNINDGKDIGKVVECDYIKKYDNTALRMAWSGTLRSAYNCNACCKRWYFTVGDQECSTPGAIDGVVYTNMLQGQTTDLHHHRHIEGYCTGTSAGPIKKGNLKIAFWIGNCAGYSDHDGYTGWNSTSRVMIEEVPM
jgi:hypothetical protein